MTPLLSHVRGLAHRARLRFASWFLRGVRVESMQFGENTIAFNPGGAGDIIRWSASQAAIAAGDIGMDTATGRPIVHDGTAARNLAALGDATRRIVRLSTGGANKTLSGLAAIDGITPSAGDRILVPDNTTGSENGIYEAASGAWTRAEDFDNAGNDGIRGGISVYVQEGTNHGTTEYVLTTTGAITIGSTALTFVQGAAPVRSDASGTEVLASGTITTAYSGGTQTGSTDCRDFSNVTWWLECTAKSSATRLDIQIQWSEDDTNFDEQGSEAISAGTATVSDYEAQFDISGDTATFVKHISLPTYGRRYAKFRVKADGGTPTVSAKVQRGA